MLLGHILLFMVTIVYIVRRLKNFLKLKVLRNSLLINIQFALPWRMFPPPVSLRMGDCRISGS